MKTKLLVEICSLEQGQKFIEEKIDALILNVMGVTYTKQFNCYTNELSFLAEKAHENNVELFINLDMLYHEDDIIGLRGILKKLYNLGITSLVISDVGVIELAGELGLDFNFINGGSILNTNFATIEYTSDLYRGYFLSNEINISEVIKISEQTSTDLIVQAFGKQKMFSSKRQLLSSYFEYNNLPSIDVHPRNYLVISDTNEQDNHSYIYEDQYGTYVYTRKNVNALKYLKQLVDNGVAYLYLNNLFCTGKEYSEVVRIFKRCLEDDSYDYKIATEDLEKVTKELGESFFNGETIYTIEQAKLLEMELKNE